MIQYAPIYRKGMKLLLLLLLFITVFQSCVSKSGPENIVIDFQDFPLSEIRTDTIVLLEDQDNPLVVGAVKPIQSGYMMYLYDNDNLMCLTDTSFNITMMVVPKGSGPTDLTGIAGKFGQDLGSGDSILSVFDPYKSAVYTLNINNGALRKHIQFPNIMSKYAPYSVTKLKNGEFISPRGDFKYGMIAYNPENNEVKEWPIGLDDIDINRPEEAHVSLRAYDYNEDSGLIAEIYGLIPTIVVHDEMGNIVRTITITGLPTTSKDSADYFRDICMTDEYIWVLCGDPDVEDSSFVVVLTHTGDPIISYEIRPTQNIALDLSGSMLITVNPNIDEHNIAVYGPNEYIHK